MRRLFPALLVVLLACGGKDTAETAAPTSADTDTDTDADADTDTDADTDSDTDTDSDPRGDDDGDGWDNVVDCDDNDPDKHPEAPEYCNGEDDDCDKFIDEAPVDPTTWYADVDGDGFGGPTTAESCTAPGGYTATYEDCDDNNDDIYPGADEICDGRDQDCDGTVDEDAIDPPTWYPDADGDGAGASVKGVTQCDPPGKGDVEETGDCDDADPTVWPGAKEICGDGVDQDCDGLDTPC